MNEVNDEQSARSAHEEHPTHDPVNRRVLEPDPTAIASGFEAPYTPLQLHAADTETTGLPHEEVCPASLRQERASPPVQGHAAMISPTESRHSARSPSSSDSTNILIDVEQQKNGGKKRDAPSMVGRKRKPNPTIHGWRLHWFIEQVKREEGLSEAEIARRAGLGQTYINAYARIEETGVSGVSLDVAQKLCDAFGMDGRYWLDRYKGERPYKLYLFDAQKQRIENERLEQRLQEMTSAASRSEQRIAKLEQELAAMSSPEPVVRVVPTQTGKSRRKKR